MTWPFLATLAALGMGAPSSAELVVESRQPIALWVLVQGRADASPIRISEVVDAASKSLRAHTDLSVLPEIGTGTEDEVRRCSAEDRMTCWTRAVRSDFAAATPVATPRALPAYLLVVSVAGTRVASLLIDAEAAVEEARRADKAADGAKERLEESIFRYAAASVPFQDVGGPAGLDAYFAGLITGDLRERLERRSHFEPWGSVELKTDVGASVEIDGAVVGTTRQNTTLVRFVKAGRREFVVSSSRGRQRLELDVRKGEISSLQAELVATEAGPTWVKPATLWSGVSVAALGGVLTAAALLASPDSAVFDACIGTDCPSRRSFATLCEITSGDSSCLRGSRGVLAAPLGYSMLITGGAWALGSLLEEGDIPWISLVVGVAAGATAYGISAALDSGSSAEAR